MSYHAPSRKLIAGLETAGGWSDADVVLSGTDAHGGPIHISRAQAAVPAGLVRRWLQVRDPAGEPRLSVVGTFVTSDGYLFKARTQPARYASAGEERGVRAPTP